MSLPALKRGKWISAATACELPRQVDTLKYEIFQYTDGPVWVTCDCGARVESYVVSEPEGARFMPLHPRGGDEREREAVESRGNEAVDEAVKAGRIDALEYLADWIKHHRMYKHPAYVGALDDMQVHVTAAIERLNRTGEMEATTPVGDIDP